MNKLPKHILIADDHGVVRYGMMLLIKDLLPFAEISQVSSFNEVVDFIKKTKICALVAIVVPKALAPARCIFENATNSRLTELSINSIHIKTIIELRLVSAPIMPMQNNANDKNKYHLISIITTLHISLFLQCWKQGLLKKYL